MIIHSLLQLPTSQLNTILSSGLRWLHSNSSEFERRARGAEFTRSSVGRASANGMPAIAPLTIWAGWNGVAWSWCHQVHSELVLKRSRASGHSRRDVVVRVKKTQQWGRLGGPFYRRSCGQISLRLRCQERTSFEEHMAVRDPCFAGRSLRPAIAISAPSRRGRGTPCPHTCRVIHVSNVGMISCKGTVSHMLSHCHAWPR